jgi:hypothetical protein
LALIGPYTVHDTFPDVREDVVTMDGLILKIEPLETQTA